MSWSYSYNMNGQIACQPVRMNLYSVPCGGSFTRVVNQKTYELKDHLGNVRVTFSDLKEPQDCDYLSDGWEATASTINNYYSFGMPMPDRNSNLDAYRFGFNGKEMDNEVYGDGVQYDYGFRIYDARLARFLSVDPLTSSYPWYTPYQFAGNKPIRMIDIDGLEEYDVFYHTSTGRFGNVIITSVDYRMIPSRNRNPNFGIGTYHVSNSPLGITNNSYTKDRLDFVSYPATEFVNNPNGQIYRAMSSGRRSEFGTIILTYQDQFWFDDDQGKSTSELQDYYDNMTPQQQKHFDGMVKMLVDNPGMNMVVTGYASQKATNIDGTLNTTTTANNNILAQERANAGEEFVVQYAQQYYNVDISSQITTSSYVRNTSANNSNNDSQNDRKVEFKVN